MSETTTEVKALLTAEDKASAVVKNYNNELTKLAKMIKALSNVKIPDITPAAIAGAARESVNAIKAQTTAIRERTSVESRAAKQRTTAAFQEARESRAVSIATMRDFRQRFAFTRAMDRQRTAETLAAERQRRTVEAATMRDMRQRLAFATRLSRQQLAMDRERQRADAQAERETAASLRRRQAGDRWRFQLRDRMDRQDQRDRNRDRRELSGGARDTWRHGRDTYRDATRTTATAALAGTAAAGVSARRILGAESSIDSAEISARIYGGLSQDAARKLRDEWASPLAEALGTGTDKLLTSYVDALKLGIPNAGAQAFSELATKTSEAWSVPFESVTDILGTVNSILTSQGDPFNFDKLKSVAKTVQHLAAKQSTTPEKLISYLQRGAGAAQVLGMSQEAGLAFGSASTSLGNQAGQSGRMFDYVASRLIEMPRLTRKHGEEGKQARDLVRALGYGSAGEMDRQRRENPDAFLPSFMDRFNRIRDPKAQDNAIRFFTGREWLGEFGRMVKGIDTYREAAKLAKEAKGLDAISQVWDLHRLKLGFVFKQFRAGWLNVLGEFGKVLSPMARQAGDYFLAWTAKLRQGGIGERFKAALQGLIEGLGFANLPALLEGMLGKPGEGNAGSVKAWGDAARGFGQGLRDVGTAISSLFTVFTGNDATPETIGRWTARLGAFAVASVALSPAIGVLAGIGMTLMSFAAVAGTAWRALKALGLGKGAGGAASGVLGRLGFTGAGLVLSRIFSLGLVAEIGANRGAIATWLLDGMKVIFSAIKEALTTGWDELKDYLSKNFDLKKIFAAILDEMIPAPLKRLLKRGTDWSTEPLPEIQQQSATGDWHGLIQPANLSTADLRNDRARARLAQRRMASLRILDFQRLNGAEGGFIGGSNSSSATVPGSPGDPARQYGQSFFTPKGMDAPGWYGKGGGGGGGSIGAGKTTVAKGALAANQMEAFKAAKAEGMSDTAARALVANMTGESLRNPRDHHWDRSHMSQGIVQWDPQRAERIKNEFGKYPKDMTVTEQTKAALWEMKKFYPRTWQSLQGSNGAQMIDTLVRDFERPQDKAGAIRDRLGHFNGFNPDANGNNQVASNGSGAGIPGLGGKGQYDGLRIKGAQAIAGGGSELGTTDLARQAQENLPGGVKHFAGFNDQFHQAFRPNSLHTKGLAFDTSLLDPSKHSEAAIAMKQKLEAAGLQAKEFMVLDEYAKLSKGGTGGHIHTQFNSREAADKYHKYIESLSKNDALASSGFQPGAGNNASALAGSVPAKMPSASEAAGSVPSRPAQSESSGSAGGGGGGGGRPGGNVQIIQNIHGAPHDPQGLATQVQRHVTEAWNYRAHDVEPELT